MRKFFVTLIVFCAIGASAFAQTFGKGTNIFSAGIGFGSSYYGSSYSTKVPPVFASYEYGIVDNLFNDGKGAIGIGGLFGFTSADWKAGNLKHTVNYFTFAASGNLHYQFVENLDTYAGINLGYYAINQSISDEYNWSDGSGDLAWGLNVGARYYFDSNLAVMAELGYGISTLSIGISYRF